MSNYRNDYRGSGYNHNRDEFEGYNESNYYDDAMNDYHNRYPVKKNKSRGFENVESNDRYSGDNYNGRNYDNSYNRRNMSNERRYDYDSNGKKYWQDNGNHDDRNHNDDRNQNEGRDWWDKTKDEVSSWFGDDDAARRRRMDEREGPHRGRGPKGYSRSDDRIKEDINDRLTDDRHLDATNIEVSVDNGEVVLNGTVDSRNAKRHAEDIADSVSGVKNVENRIRIKSNFDSNSSASNSGTSNAYAGSAFNSDKS